MSEQQQENPHIQTVKVESFKALYTVSLGQMALLHNEGAGDEREVVNFVASCLVDVATTLVLIGNDIDPKEFDKEQFLSAVSEQVDLSLSRHIRGTSVLRT